jgi:hypothetical protein
VSFSTQDFVRLAQDSFGWLVDRGFTVVEISAENLYGGVLFVNEVTHVRVALDIHDQSLDVQIGPVAGSRATDGARLPDGTRARFPLWLILWVKTADEKRARSLSEYSEESELGVRAALEANTQALEEAAGDVLAGDFTILSRADLADSARIEANIAGRPWPSTP